MTFFNPLRLCNLEVKLFDKEIKRYISIDNIEKMLARTAQELGKNTVHLWKQKHTHYICRNLTSGLPQF